ncbi:MAG: three-Cys-motif partner protein TcmP [Thermoproteota archaeon]
MSEINSTTWPLDPHTKAKHDILREYLKPWFPILSRYADRIIYLDGFAGPGVYSKDEEGSPVIAVRTAVEHTMRKNFKKIVFWFIEKNQQRFEKLQQVLKEKFPELENKDEDQIIYRVQKSEFSKSLEKTLDALELQGSKLAPTFAFLDPFGFSGLPMNLIKRMLDYKKCEVLVTFMAGFVLRFHDELRENALNELYATEEWKKVNEYKTPDEKRKFLLELYVKQLKNIGGAKFIRTFEMISSDNNTIYHLVYGTKHWKGLEVIKRAMLKVGHGGTYKFSDRTDPNQTFLLDYGRDEFWVPEVGKMIFQHFRGQQVPLETINEFVITETPFLFKKTKVLTPLEKTNPPKITNVSNRTTKRLDYPEGCIITFAK